jgi:predicted dehydrogenase
VKRDDRTGADAPVLFALLGTAHIHVPDYVAVLTTHPKARLTAVYPGDARWRHPIPVGAVLCCAEAQEALSRADAALIASTTAEHEELLGAVLNAGMPALIEKPLAANAELAGRMATSVRHPTIAAAMFLRHAPAVRRLRELYVEGVVGPALEVSASFSHDGLDAGIFADKAAWMLVPECGAVGGFADLGIHLIDLIRWLLADIAPDERAVTVARARLRSRAGLPLDIGGEALLDWNGVRVSIRAAWDENPGGLHIAIRGPRGSLTVHDAQLEITPLDRRLPRREQYPLHRASAVLEAFIADLRLGSSGDGANARDLAACADLLDRIYSRSSG